MGDTKTKTLPPLMGSTAPPVSAKARLLDDDEVAELAALADGDTDDTDDDEEGDLK